MPKRTVHLLLKVKCPMKMSNDRLKKLVNMMLDIGYADAQQTQDLMESNLDADDVVSLNIDKPKILNSFQENYD